MTGHFAQWGDRFGIGRQYDLHVINVRGKDRQTYIRACVAIERCILSVKTDYKECLYLRSWEDIWLNQGVVGRQLDTENG